MIDRETRPSAHGPGGGGPGPRHRKYGSGPGRRLMIVGLALVVAVPLAILSGSYVRALTYPGSASWQDRTVAWVRDHGGGPLVDAVEAWYYSHNQPSATGAPDQPLPHRTDRSSPHRAGRAQPVTRPVTLPHLPGVRPVPGEATWSPGVRRVHGRPVLYSSFFRPDPHHTTVVAGAAWMDQRLVRTTLVAGTVDPGGSGPVAHAQVPKSARPSLVAAFNSGFKLKDAHGGFYAGGRTERRLRKGAASLVIDTNGTVRIGSWGRDITWSPRVAAVRQNLRILVRHGHPVHGLHTNAHGAWGSVRSQFEYTWRSGIGTDAHGDLIYVAGDGLTLSTLAHAMADAGIRTGMQLDIHPDMVTFNMFAPHSGGGLNARKLLPAMVRPATRYLQPDQRDFFYVTLR